MVVIDIFFSLPMANEVDRYLLRMSRVVGNHYSNWWCLIELVLIRDSTLPNIANGCYELVEGNQGICLATGFAPIQSLGAEI